MRNHYNRDARLCQTCPMLWSAPIQQVSSSSCPRRLYERRPTTRRGPTYGIQTVVRLRPLRLSLQSQGAVPYSRPARDTHPAIRALSTPTREVSEFDAPLVVSRYSDTEKWRPRGPPLRARNSGACSPASRPAPPTRPRFAERALHRQTSR
jgi:hypothetical protein